MVTDAVDSALDSEDMEEEIEEEVDKVLTEIAGETAAQLPEAVRKERVRVPAQEASTSREVRLTSINFFACLVWGRWDLTSLPCSQEEAIAEGVDDEEELEELRARLAKVRS